MNGWSAYATIWIVTGIVVLAGVYLTHSANCLWALLIPALINVKES